MIPTNFEEWKYCITEKCHLELTEEFVLERIKILNDPTHKETKHFIKLYGKNHWQNILRWYVHVRDTNQVASL